jgi:hypothetical protein
MSEFGAVGWLGEYLHMSGVPSSRMPCRLILKMLIKIEKNVTIFLSDATFVLILT